MLLEVCKVVVRLDAEQPFVFGSDCGSVAGWGPRPPPLLVREA